VLAGVPGVKHLGTIKCEEQGGGIGKLGLTLLVLFLCWQVFTCDTLMMETS
jgi:hypothetical protein